MLDQAIPKATKKGAVASDSGGLTMAVGFRARSITMHSELDSKQNNLGK